MRTLNVQPEETKEGKIYHGRKLIKALRESEYGDMVFIISSSIEKDMCLVECAMMNGDKVVATSAVTRSLNDDGPNGDMLGTFHTQAAVTIAKKECIMDYFGLVEEYNELPVKSDIQAGIEKLLNEQNR